MSDPNVLTWAATLVSLAVAIPTAGHAVIYKRDPRSATLWVLLIALLPLVTVDAEQQDLPPGRAAARAAGSG